LGVIDSIVRIADFVLQGLLFLFVVWYALHGISSFDEWFKDKVDLFLGRKRNSTDSNNTVAFVFTETVMFAVIIGGAYAIGLATNSLSFVVLEPPHEHIIKVVREDKTFDPFSWPLVFSPIRRTVSHHEQAVHVRSLCEELAWKSEKRELAQAELEPLVKQLRVLRGAMVCFLTLTLVCFVKFCIQLVQRRRGSYHQSSRWWLPIVYTVLSFLFYIGCMQAWAFVEADYHLNVYLGLQTASAATLTSAGNSSPPSAPSGLSSDALCASLSEPQAGVSEVDAALNDFHDAASNADFDRYFSHFADNAVFLGTDSTERWTTSQFRKYAKSGFEHGGWTYIPKERHVFLSEDGNVAWFDEKTYSIDKKTDSKKYGEMRGTGVLIKSGKTWKLVQYSLLKPIPNDLFNSIVGMIEAPKGQGTPSTVP
jgi:ketosteroid isomerase-like protein